MEELSTGISISRVNSSVKDDAHSDSKRAMHGIAKSKSVSLDGKRGVLRLVAR